MGTKIRLKDTGLNKVGGTVDYTAVNSGAWTDLSTFQLRGEFTVNTTNNVSTKTDSSNSSQLTFVPNEISAIQGPRFTLQGLVSATDTTLIANIINFERSKGVKRISGGAGLIAALPEVLTDTYNYVSVIVKNVTFSEVVKNGENYINFTIQLEQVN